MEPVGASLVSETRMLLVKRHLGYHVILLHTCPIYIGYRSELSEQISLLLLIRFAQVEGRWGQDQVLGNPRHSREAFGKQQ